MHTYTRQYNIFPWYLHDAPVRDLAEQKPNQKILEQYLIDAQAILATKIASLIDFAKPFTATDEKHLSSMMTLLVDARKMWEEESHSS